jgi:hypothetical protein
MATKANSTTRSAPRPGYRRAWLAYRLGLPRPIGYRWLSGPSWYRQMSRAQARKEGGAQ